MRRALIIALLLSLTPAAVRAAETAYLYETNPTGVRIVALDAVGTVYGDTLPVTGLGAGDAIAALDVRPSDGALYALTVNTATNPDHAELYRLEVGEASVSAVSVGVPAFTPSGSFGIAFNPATDRLRVVSSNGLNLRLNPDTGAVAGTDTETAFAPGDPNAGTPPAISGIAYAGRSLLAIATADELLARIGGPDGDEPSPNTGLTYTLGATGVGSGVGQDSLEVSATDGAAYWLRSGFFRAEVWRLDPATGVAQSGIPFDLAATAMALAPAATVSLGSAVASFAESAGSALLLVNRSTPRTGAVSVPYTVEPGTADVAAASGTLTFAEGETQKELVVPVPADTAVEGRETFTVRLGDPAGNRSAGAVLGTATTTVNVEDDDAPVVPGTGAPPVSPGAAADRSWPTVRLTGVPRRTLTRAQLLRGFTIRALPSEIVSLEVSLRANPRRGVFASAYELALFTRRYGRSPFTRTVRVRPSRRLVGRITRRTKLRLVVEATDAAGNRRTMTRTVYVRR